MCALSSHYCHLAGHRMRRVKASNVGIGCKHRIPASMQTASAWSFSQLGSKGNGAQTGINLKAIKGERVKDQSKGSDQREDQRKDQRTNLKETLKDIKEHEGIRIEKSMENLPWSFLAVLGMKFSVRTQNRVKFTHDAGQSPVKILKISKSLKKEKQTMIRENQTRRVRRGLMVAWRFHRFSLYRWLYSFLQIHF